MAKPPRSWAEETPHAGLGQFPRALDGASHWKKALLDLPQPDASLAQSRASRKTSIMYDTDQLAGHSGHSQNELFSAKSYTKVRKAVLFYFLRLECG